MSDIKWIKLSTSMFEDEKIRLIEQMPDADTILIIWVKLLAQAGKTNASGYIYLSENIPYTEEMLATIFDRPLSTVRLALRTFQDFGMITIDKENYIAISNWEKHQNIEGMERVRKLNAERNRRYRERKKQKQLEAKKDSDVSVTSRDGTDIDKDIEQDIDKERDIKNKHIRDLYDHYLSKNIIQHRKLTEQMKRNARARLRDYPFESLKKAIDNYAKVLHSDNHWFTHKYPFADLMREKDITRFLDESDPLNNFIKKSRTGKGLRQEVIPDWFERREHEKEYKANNEHNENVVEIKKLLEKYQSEKESEEQV